MNLQPKLSLICLFTFLLSIGTLCGFGQIPDSYLSTHATDLSSGMITTDQAIGDGFYDHQLFLVGEIHGIKRGQDVDLAFLKLLNQKLKLTTYIMEVDFAKAYLLNQYLESGDESLIDAVFEDWIAQNAQWANTDFQDKIRKIRVYNQSLNAVQRIHFEGIDRIQHPLLVARYFKEVLKGKWFENYSSLFDPLMNALELKSDSLIRQCAGQLLTTLKDKSQFKKTGNNWKNTMFALKNCSLIQSPREEVMQANFKELYKIRNWKREKLYSFLGFGHILQSKVNDGKGSFLAYRLENDPELPLKGKIVSIAMIYLDSKMSMPTVALPAPFQDKGKRFTAFSEYNHDGPLIKLNGIDAFKLATKPNTTTLFNLNAIGSPYLNQILAIKYADMMPKDQRLYFNEKEKFMTDYFQYVVLIRNSAQTNPILP